MRQKLLTFAAGAICVSASALPAMAQIQTVSLTNFSTTGNPAFVSNTGTTIYRYSIDGNSSPDIIITLGALVNGGQVTSNLAADGSPIPNSAILDPNGFTGLLQPIVGNELELRLNGLVAPAGANASGQPLPAQAQFYSAAFTITSLNGWNITRIDTDSHGQGNPERVRYLSTNGFGFAPFSSANLNGLFDTGEEGASSRTGFASTVSGIYEIYGREGTTQRMTFVRIDVSQVAPEPATFALLGFGGLLGLLRRRK
jgi:hypothetical protein